MFSCLWQLWDWLDPTSMDNKKAAYQNSTVTPSNELPANDALPKHSHQHNTAPQHLRLLQYGLKIPNHQINHQQMNSPLHLHVHQHNSQLQYQTHRHIQPSPQFNNINIHSNPVLLHNNTTTQKYGHLHQQKPMYQTPPPPANPYNQMAPNTPQIWVPHQPPVHYHQQQQQQLQNQQLNKTEPPKPTNPTTQSPSQPQPKPREVLERKKSSSSSIQQLRSPSAKRPLEAPVTMQGWLHKQGSEGLMLWKRRWFVLSEYCLFYYKGPEEEKLLGSILLPSYKVSACVAEDKVNKKYSFKCEHVNMRTYVLAADSQELMNQWIKVLNLACNLQTNTEAEQTVQTENVNSRTTPIHTHSSSNTTDLSQQELSQYNQPLYANAPPKPRRLNDGYSSPSPDILDRYSSPQNPQYIQQMHGCRNLAKSPISMYGHPMLVPHKHEYVFNPHNIPQNSERRTPDTYGRSQLVTKSRGTDYEDVYAEQSMYKRPLSPIAYSHINVVKKANPTINPAYRAYTPVNMLGPKELEQYGPPIMRKSPSTIARPHSADFLEYESNHRQQNPIPTSRPKSSLDINRNDNDNYFYSEERYAEKMRKSAQYLQKVPLRYPPQHNEFVIQPKPMPRYQETENTYPLMRSNTQPINFNNLPVKDVQTSVQPVRSRSVLSEGSLSKELDVDLRSSPRDRLERESISPGFSTRQEMYNYAQNMKNREYDQFTRSASARLAQNPGDGDRKREESMKRLLEWKQRMLQSPLNRKVQGNRRTDYYQENGFVQQKHIEPPTDGRRSVNNLPQYNSYSSDDEASGSISLNTRDTFPRSMPAKRMWTPTQNLQARSVTNLNRNETEPYLSQPQGYFVNHSNQHEADMAYATRKAQLHLMDQQKRLENIQKLEQLKQHLLDLEKQYEKGKPLVNLVDNMVKLGTLYRNPNDHNNIVNPYIRDRLEFNQQIQERRLLAEEKRDWNRITPNHYQLQEKVQQLYQLDRLIQEESGTLQNLQQDKEDIERALGGLRLRLNKGFNDPAEIEQARKQQIMLENELSRVHFMLAQNSKKLEETVAGNARLEQELLVLKQKLQTSRQQRSSPQFSSAGDSLPCVVGTNVMLESDLHRVQKKIGDLQKQRQELSMQVRQLTDRSNNLPQNKSSSSNNLQSLALGNKKKVTSSWRETDLDTMNIVDHGDSWDNSTTPLYINTDIKQSPDEYYNRIMKSSDSTSDDTTMNSNLPQEKQEIKTVRIVKRESERRQRDREKITTTGKWDALLEEDDSSQNSSILFRPTPVQKTQSSTSLSLSGFIDSDNSALTRQNSLSSPSLPQYSDNRGSSNTNSSERSPELSPIFKSEAARQIITEMSIQETPKKTNRRAVPKEKRRHYTAPHNNLIMKSLNQLPTDDNAFDKMILNTRRARDDLDMERALRQRIDAPDVVRSTLSNKELKYNESTIDNILGTPNKINIPERYIPEQLPQLSAEEQEHRLRKVESIKKMLSDTAIISGSSNNATDEKTTENAPSLITNKATTKMIEEKKQREHLLQLNQILAKQVMEMSKIVAVKALQKLPLQPQQMSTEDEDSSPITPLPLYQQRDNFYS